ncbi:hypothetical protein [Actinoplanes sp. L3-i22]|uniref:hypothetical protein n=1 Tax=Actinoplanes sp. L3-i22 TaxID=2836373 RepID=UPI001C842F5C|nr:hypothetical protein [Actinoplanes sp. L3-i22]
MDASDGDLHSRLTRDWAAGGNDLLARLDLAIPAARPGHPRRTSWTPRAAVD